MNMITADQQEQIERLARKRAGAKMGFYIHAAVFAAVNLMLFLMAAGAGRSWNIYPAWGWGLGLAIHGVMVFFLMGGSSLHRRLVDAERKRLQLQNDPW